MIETNGRQGRPTSRGTSRGTAPRPRARAANRSSTLQYSHSAYISIITYPHIHIAYILYMDISACWPYIHIPRYLSQYITSLSTHYTHIIITFTVWYPCLLNISEVLPSSNVRSCSNMRPTVPMPDTKTNFANSNRCRGNTLG